MGDLVRPYRGVSAAQRSADRRRRLIEGALDLIGERGLSGVTMKGVCAAAGLTERYYYESFKSLDELLAAVIESILADLDAAMTAAMAASPAELAGRAHAVLDTLVGILISDPRYARAYFEASGDPALRRLQAAALERNAKLIASQMRELGGQTDGHSLDLAALVLVGGAERAFEAWIDGRLDVSRADLVAEITRLCVAAASQQGLTPDAA